MTKPSATAATNAPVNALGMSDDATEALIAGLPEPLLTQAAIDALLYTAKATDTDPPVQALISAVEQLARERARLAAEYAALAAQKDGAYLERNIVVRALAACYPSGIARTAIEGWSADWHGCVYIDLPSGQVSYHYHDSIAHLFADLPPYAGKWDGHDKDTVHERLLRSARSQERGEG